MVQDFKVIILGCHSSIPMYNKYNSSQVLNLNNNLFLIDCGESTQMQLRKAKIKYNKINNIFISHLHGDHYYGLIGLLSTFQLNNRTKDLSIYCPYGLKNILDTHFKWSYMKLSFKINYIILKSFDSELIYQNDLLEVYTIPMKHNIYNNGFLFKEKIKKRKIDKDKINKYKIQINDFKKLQNGEDIYINNKKIYNKELTIDPPKPRSYAYCSDTLYNLDLLKYIKNIDLLYHDSTYLNNDLNLAIKKKHSTAFQAAKIAKLANVNKLILGHYSIRYNNLLLFLNEAKKIFKDTDLALEFKIISL